MKLGMLKKMGLLALSLALFSGCGKSANERAADKVA